MPDGVVFWWRFVKNSARQGWTWLVTFGAHLGAVGVVLGEVASGLLAWTASTWWIAAVYTAVVLFIAFSVGAYSEWRDAGDAIAALAITSMDATLAQLRGERGRANTWLTQLRDATDDKPADTIKFIFDTFWIQTLQQLIRPRAPQLWASFHDEVDDALAPLANTERERVFTKVQLAVKRLDTVIVQIEQDRQEMRGFMRKDPVKT
jgi:hypothetical protein